jgi:hypothetical protein
VHIDHSPYNCFAAAGWGGHLWLWPAPALDNGENDGRSVPAQGVERHFCGGTSDVLSMAYCAPAQLVATGAINGEITIWSLLSGGGKATLTRPCGEEASRARGVDGGGGGAEKTDQQAGGESRRLWPEGLDVSVECLAFLDPNSHALAAAPTLVSGGADGFLRVWNVRALGGGTGHAFAVRGACAVNESITALGVSDGNDSLATGDSEGRVEVWDVSALVAAISHRKPACAVAGNERHLVRRSSWRAHRQVIVQVEMVQKREVLITASTDCSVMLWTLHGARIGTFGQAKPWNMNQPPRALETALPKEHEEATGGGRTTAREARAKTTGAYGGNISGRLGPSRHASFSNQPPPLQTNNGAWPIGGRRVASVTGGATELRKVLREAHASRFGEGEAASLAAATLEAFPPSDPVSNGARFGSRSDELIARLLPPPAGSANASRALRSPSRAALLVANSLPPLETGPAGSALAAWRKRGLGAKAFAPEGWAPEVSLASSCRAGPRPPPLSGFPHLVLLPRANAVEVSSPSCSPSKGRFGDGRARQCATVDSGGLKQMRGSISLPDLQQHGPRLAAGGAAARLESSPIGKQRAPLA